MNSDLGAQRRTSRGVAGAVRDAFTRSMIRYLLRKYPPERIWLGCEAALKNDYYLISIESLPGEADRAFQIYGVRGRELQTTFSDGHEPHERILTLDDLRSGTLDIAHWCGWWTVHYRSLPIAVLAEFLCYQRLRWRRHVRRDKHLRTMRNRYRVLAEIADLAEFWTHSQVDFMDLLRGLYGRGAESSPQVSKLIGFLTTILESLKESGDVLFAEGLLPKDIRITPKALSTLSDYEVETTRHADSMRIAKGQLWVSVAMVILALASLVVALLDM